LLKLEREFFLVDLELDLEGELDNDLEGEAPAEAAAAAAAEEGELVNPAALGVYNGFAAENSSSLIELNAFTLRGLLKVDEVPSFLAEMKDCKSASSYYLKSKWDGKQASKEKEIYKK
jgi:hypothetical protein